LPSRSRKTTAEVLELERLADSASDVRQVTMGHRVFLSIKRAIVHGRLVPGYPVSEAELAGQLGVSRQPVREAFIKLADMGLVEIRPQRGTFIQRISRREVENARFLREAIEVAIARRAAEVASAEAVRPLWDLVEDQARCGVLPDHSQFLALDDALHHEIARMADCERGWRLIEDLKAQMDRVRYLSISSATPADTIVSQHRILVQAIADRSPDAAEAAMRHHLREMLKSLPIVIENNADAFDL
jgi:GntR family transcriptional regulator, rspAB operon transcriptional repressor|tara:strand:- start:12 stop:746 length:735 start_codon:yes stop_codon:yes gene_type:complete